MTAPRPRAALLAATTRDALTQLSVRLGAADDLVLFAEGNASAATAPGRLLVKSSGVAMGAMDGDDLVEVDYAEILAGLRRPMSDRAWAALVAGSAVPAEVVAVARNDVRNDARGDAGGAPRPSIEVPVHAVGVGLCGAGWVAHTHPTSVNALLCSVRPEVLTRPMFPDQVVVCGPRYPLVPYVDPGQALGDAFRRAVEQHRDEFGEWPRAVLLASHGMVALGDSPEEVFAITMMMSKAARIAVGAMSAGGVAGLPDADVARLAAREDELYRRGLLRGPRDR